MNERLKFSWGHIIAFVALIAVSYISFVGFTYLTGGNFAYAIVGMALTDIFYLIVFIGAQQLKASGVKMRRKIMVERILIFGSPLVFVAGMVSMSHFWTVRGRNDSIVAAFKESIKGSRQLFSDYEEYSERRIETYDYNLSRIIADRAENPSTFRDAGFDESKVDVQKKNMVETLELQLLSNNYDALESLASKWLSDAARDASIWNVFLIGNTREIKDALDDWDNQLTGNTEKRLSNESVLGKVPEFESDGLKKGKSGIEKVNVLLTKQSFPGLAAVIYGVVIYLMLLLPYLLQERHTKSIYRLLGDEHKSTDMQNPESEYDRVYKKINDREKGRESEKGRLPEDDSYPSF